jgi:membrane-associated phospholipid phosphatase
VTARLVPWPRVAVGLLVSAAAVVTLLAVRVHGKTSGNRYDNKIDSWIQRTVPDTVLRHALHLTDPPFVVALLGSVAIIGSALRRWDVTALAVFAPGLAVVLTEQVLKPVVHRSAIGPVHTVETAGVFAFPSGHETGIASLVAVLGLLLLGSTVRPARKIAGLAVLSAVLVAAAGALVGLSFHYATDTIGAIGVAIAATVGVALVIDRVSAAVSVGLAAGEPSRRAI